MRRLVEVVEGKALGDRRLGAGFSTSWKPRVSLRTSKIVWLSNDVSRLRISSASRLTTARISIVRLGWVISPSPPPV
jgi:hypothetical protein